MKPIVHSLPAIAAACVLALASRALSQGALAPPGPPAAGMKTLAQVAPRVPIAGTNITLSQPGSYYLTTNIAVASGDGITIAANNITLDLNGFTLISSGSGGSAINFAASQTNISILNGFINSGITNNGSNSYGGNGWARGVFSSYPVFNVRLSGLSIHGCSLYGIYLGTGTPTLVKGCTVGNTGWGGILADVVVDCVAAAGGYNASPAVQATLAVNCRGTSYSGPGVLATQVAANCAGTSTTGTGVSAPIVDNCSGTSTSQIGVVARIANNASGSSGSSRGVSTVIGKNSLGSTANSATFGFYASGLAIGCYGANVVNSGIYGYILNSCAGTDSSAGFKYNMP